MKYEIAKAIWRHPLANRDDLGQWFRDSSPKTMQDLDAICASFCRLWRNARENYPALIGLWAHHATVFCQARETLRVWEGMVIS